MNARENILNCVHFNQPQYIPMVFHINTACWDHYPQDFLIEQMGCHRFLFPDVDPADEFVVPQHPRFARSSEPFTDPWGCLWETSMDGIIGAVTRHPLQNWNDLPDYTPPDPDQRTHWGPVDWSGSAAIEGPIGFMKTVKAAEIGHGHTFLKLIDIRGYQNVLFDMADDEPRLRTLIDMIEAFNIQLVRNYVTYHDVEWMGFAEDLGMQSGPMLSPEHFRDYIKPSYQRMMRIARDAGCIIHMHSDGDIRTLVGDLIEGGVDIVNLQDLVNGIDWIKDNLVGKVCIDLDIDRQTITARGGPAQIDALIRKEVETLGSKDGGLMMIYGLYPGVPLENVTAVMDAMERYATFYS